MNYLPVALGLILIVVFSGCLENSSSPLSDNQTTSAAINETIPSESAQTPSNEAVNTGVPSTDSNASAVQQASSSGGQTNETVADSSSAEEVLTNSELINETDDVNIGEMI